MTTELPNLRIWAGYPDVDRAVDTISLLWGKSFEPKELPPLYVKAVKETMELSSKGLILRFFDELSKKCPEALKYF